MGSFCVGEHGVGWRTHMVAVGGPAEAPNLSRAEKTRGWKSRTDTAYGLARTSEWAERS